MAMGKNPHNFERTDEMPEFSSAALSEDAPFQELLKAARSAPKDHAAWSAVGDAILERLISNPSSGELQIDALDTFSYLLTIEPNDAAAIRALGDLCFDQRLFQKALAYYERYLTLYPNDLDLRSRHASTLTFLGRPQEAVLELETVVAEQPNAFQPLAYLSIALSQKGDIEKARAVGEQALAQAPSPEARERFSAFLESLLTPDSSSSSPAAPRAETPTTTSQPATLAKESWLEKLEQTLRANPIAGPKVVGVAYREESKTVEISLTKFPMEAMPDFARQKFIGSLTPHLPHPLVTTLRFLDAESGRVMLGMAVQR
jgi:tetratricopeptide (TPR) repeat protein